MTTPLKIQIIVDDKGSVKIRQVGTEAEKAGRKGETAFRRTGKSLDEMNRKTAAASSHMLKLAATAVSIGTLYLAFRKLAREVSEFIDLAGKQEAVEKRVEAVLKATGQAAGYNLSQITAMASGMQRLTTVGDEVILSGQAILLTFKKIRGEGFERATMAALDMAEVMEGDLKGSVVMIGKALNDPIANLSAMTRAGVQFTAGQKDMIKQLWEAGKEMEAQNIILTELESQFGGTAAAARETFSGMKAAAGNALGDVEEQLGFIVTKNAFVVEGLKILEAEFVSWGEEIKNNEEDLQSLAKNGMLALADGTIFTVNAVGKLIVGMKSLSGYALTLESVWLTMKEWSIKLADPFGNDKIYQQMLTDIKQAQVDVANAQVELATNITNTDATVDALVDRLMALRKRLAEVETGTVAAGGSTNNFGGDVDDLALSAEEAAKQVKALADEISRMSETDPSGLYAFITQEDLYFNLELGPGFADAANVLAAVNREVAKTKDYFKGLDDLMSRAGSSFKGESFGDAMSQGINNAMRSFEALSAMYEEQTKIEKELIEKRKEANNIEDIEERIKALEKIGDIEMELIGDQLSGYRQLFGTLKDLFDENSKEREAMHKAEQAFAILEIALEMRKSLAIVTGYFAQSAAATVAATTQNAANTSTALTGAVASVAAQGTVPVAGFAMVGAMLALMAGVLAMGGIAFGGGGGTSAPSVPTLPASTVLGAAAGTGSESIENSFEMLKEFHAEEYGELIKIYNELQDLNQNITGLVTEIVKAGTGFYAGGEITTEGPWKDNIENTLGLINKAMGLIDPVSKFVTGAIGWLADLMFGGGIKQTVTYAGIQIDEQTMGAILEGADVIAKSYQTISQVIEGGMFGSDEWSVITKYADLDEDVTRLLTKVFQSIGKSFISLAEGLGTDTQAVMDYVMKTSGINLLGMDAEAANKAVQEFFSNMTDTMAEDLFGPILKQYQQIGEGLYETAVRVVAEKEIILQALETTGHAFTAFGENAAIFAEGGLFFNIKFIEGVGTFEEQAVAFTQAIIVAAGGLEEFTDAFTSYYDAFFTDAEKQSDLQKQLSSAFEYLNETYSDLAGTLPSTKAGYRDLVEGLDLTTESGIETYVALLKLADAADTYYDSIEDATEKIIETQRKLLGTTESGDLRDIEKRYKLPFGTITEAWAKDIIDAFTRMSPEEVIDWAADLGVTADELTDDIMTLAQAFDSLGGDLTQIGEDIRAMLSNISGSFSGTDTAAMLMTQITGLQGLPMADQTGDNLLAMSEKLIQWYNAAVAEAEEAAREEAEVARLWIQVADSIASLVDQIDSAILSIKTSGLNVSLPTQIAQEIAVDYEAAYTAAQAGGTAEIQKYLSIAQTHLGTYQAAHKSSQDYQDEYARVMGHMADIKSKAEAGGYDAQILAELTSGNEEIHADLSGIQATFSEMEGWILNALQTLEDLSLIINIDWGNWDGDQAEALRMLLQLVDVYGWDHEYTLKFLAEVPLDIFENLDQLAAAAGWIADQSGGWNSTATIAFIKNVAENWDFENLDEIFAAANYIKTKAGSWGADASIAFIATLQDRYGVPLSDMPYWLDQMGLGATEIPDVMAKLILQAYGAGDMIDNIDAFLESLGITDVAMRRDLEVQLMYNFVASGDVSMAGLGDWAYAKMVTAATTEDLTQAHNLLEQVKQMAALFGVRDPYQIGYQIALISPEAQAGGWSDLNRAQQAAYDIYSNRYDGNLSWAMGGIATGPETGYDATLHGTELIVSPRSSYPATVVNGGSTQQGSNSPIELNLTIELDGKVLDTKIVQISRREADDIRIQAARRPGIGTGRIV